MHEKMPFLMRLVCIHNNPKSWEFCKAAGRLVQK